MCCYQEHLSSFTIMHYSKTCHSSDLEMTNCYSELVMPSSNVLYWHVTTYHKSLDLYDYCNPWYIMQSDNTDINYNTFMPNNHCNVSWAPWVTKIGSKWPRVNCSNNKFNGNIKEFLNYSISALTTIMLSGWIWSPDNSWLLTLNSLDNKSGSWEKRCHCHWISLLKNHWPLII